MKKTPNLDNLDDFSDLLLLVWAEIDDIQECLFQYTALKEIMSRDLGVFHIAPNFFCKVVYAFEYKIITGTARFYDKEDNRNDTLCLAYILKKAENLYRNKANLVDFVKRKKVELDTLDVEDLRFFRDKYYSHLDKKAFEIKPSNKIIFMPKWELDIETLLRFAKEVIVGILSCLEITIPTTKAFVPDIDNLVKQLNYKYSF